MLGARRALAIDAEFAQAVGWEEAIKAIVATTTVESPAVYIGLGVVLYVIVAVGAIALIVLAGPGCTMVA